MKTLKELLAPLGVVGGAVLVIISLILSLVLWLVIILTIPLWVPAHVILTNHGRRGFVIERSGRIKFSFSLDAFKKL
jgi:hypothetical protein